MLMLQCFNCRFWLSGYPL